MVRVPGSGEEGERDAEGGEGGCEFREEGGGYVEVAGRVGDFVRGGEGGWGGVEGFGGVLEGPDEEEVWERDEAEDRGVVVGQREGEGEGGGEGVLEEDERGEGGAAAELRGGS